MVIDSHKWEIDQPNDQPSAVAIDRHSDRPP
jgi:hypothetical protein